MAVQISGDCPGITFHGTPVQIIADRLYFACFDQNPRASKDVTFFTFDTEAHYEPFYSDFGPYNLSVLYSFCERLDAILQKRKRRRIVYHCGTNPEQRVNGAFLIGAAMIVKYGRSAEEMWDLLKDSEPPKLIGFRDAAMGPSTYDLALSDVLKGVQRAVELKWLNFATFNQDEYEYYERVENGDLNWIIPGKCLAFCGPHAKSVVDTAGYPYHAPEVYFKYFRQTNVKTVVRLNKKLYDASRFSKAGFSHVDLFFIDGTTPNQTIVRRFMEVLDTTDGAVAVHCKAGLGRTGTLIACWMMKEYGLTAAECIGWMRIARPGSIIGPQQRFLIDNQKWCWTLGKQMRSKKPTSAMIGEMVGGGQTMLANGHLQQIANKIDDIRINNNSTLPSPTAHHHHHHHRLRGGADASMLRPNNVLPAARRPNRLTTTDDNGNLLAATPRGLLENGDSHEETKTDMAGRTQGDRLLAIKAKRQHDTAPGHPPLSLRVTSTSADSGGSGKARFTSPTTPIKPLAPPRRQHPLHVDKKPSASTSTATRKLNLNEQTLLPSKVPRVVPIGSETPPVRPKIMKASGKSAAAIATTSNNDSANLQTKRTTLSGHRSYGHLGSANRRGAPYQIPHLPPKPPNYAKQRTTTTTTQEHSSAGPHASTSPYSLRPRRSGSASPKADSNSAVKPMQLPPTSPPTTKKKGIPIPIPRKIATERGSKRRQPVVVAGDHEHVVAASPTGDLPADPVHRPLPKAFGTAGDTSAIVLATARHHGDQHRHQ